MLGLKLNHLGQRGSIYQVSYAVHIMMNMEKKSHYIYIIVEPLLAASSQNNDPPNQYFAHQH